MLWQCQFLEALLVRHADGEHKKQDWQGFQYSRLRRSYFRLQLEKCMIQWTLVIVNAWIVNNLSLVNIFGETGRLFYNINYMLNSKHLSLVNKIGDKTEFTITRVHCTKYNSVLVFVKLWDLNFSKNWDWEFTRLTNL